MSRCTTLRALAVLLSFVCIPSLCANQGNGDYTTITSTTTIATTKTVYVEFSTNAAASIVTSAAATAENLTSTSSADMSYTGTAFQAAILNSTNYYRAQHDAADLTWNATLAAYAQDYARECIWKHSVSDSYMYSSVCCCDQKKFKKLTPCAGWAVRRESCRGISDVDGSC